MKTRLLKQLRKLAFKRVYLQCVQCDLNKVELVIDNSDWIAANFPGTKSYYAGESNIIGLNYTHKCTTCREMSYGFSIGTRESINKLHEMRRYFICCVIKRVREDIRRETEIKPKLREFEENMKARNKMLRMV